jgi:hypothetical protein
MILRKRALRTASWGNRGAISLMVQVSLTSSASSVKQMKSIVLLPAIGWSFSRSYLPVSAVYTTRRGNE